MKSYYVLFCFVLFCLGGGVYSVVHTYNFNFTIIFLLQFFTGLKKGRGGKYLIIHCLISHVNSRKIFAATKIRGRCRPLMATLMLRAWWVLKQFSTSRRYNKKDILQAVDTKKTHPHIIRGYYRIIFYRSWVPKKSPLQIVGTT